jgi:quinol monooxygenase YgiN
MSRVARYVRFRARSGQGDALAAGLLEAAAALEQVAGCELYLINREAADRDVVWVTELWRSREDVEASLQADGAKESIAEVMALVDGTPELTELVPEGGVGAVDAADGVPGYTRVALRELDDMAARHGLGAIGEARFANTALDTRATGISLQSLRPGMRQAFGHRHHAAEEVYVVLGGGGRVCLDDEVVEVTAGDAIRVAPPVARAFEAGPDGLEVLACGPRHAGDAETLMGWWGAS